MRRWIAFPLIVVCLATTTGAFALEECDGPFKGKKPTHDQLAEVLANHQAWVTDDFPDGDERRANLCEANLRGAALSSTDLSYITRSRCTKGSVPVRVVLSSVDWLSKMCGGGEAT